MTNEEYMLKTVRSEIRRATLARKRTEELARRSFCNWSHLTIAKVGRALGYIISIPRKSFIPVFNWQFYIKTTKKTKQ